MMRCCRGHGALENTTGPHSTVVAAADFILK